MRMPAFLSRFLKGDAAYHAAIKAQVEARKDAAFRKMVDLVDRLVHLDLAVEHARDTIFRQAELDDFERAHIAELLRDL